MHHHFNSGIISQDGKDPACDQDHQVSARIAVELLTERLSMADPGHVLEAV